MNTRIKKILVLIIPAVVCSIVTYATLRNILFMPAQPGSVDLVRFEIAQGKGFSQITSDLKEKNLIRSAWGLKLLARLKSSGATIKAGEYELSPSMTPIDILKKLVSGDVVKRRVLVKEGATLADIGASLEQAGVIKKDEFVNAAKDRTFLEKAGIDAASFEGYLYPDTYFFSRPVSVQDVLWTMFEEAEKHWDPEFSNQLDALHLTRHEALTLASIIEKETGKVEEMPIISSVFHNRLIQGWKLESDPTVIYGLKDYDGNITKADLLNPHPYNTYQHLGLPPGPIANPSERAIRAALYPAATNYVFFVADGTGGHVFSTSLKDHNEAVARYIKLQASGSEPGTVTPAPTEQPVLTPAPTKR